MHYALWHFLLLYFLSAQNVLITLLVEEILFPLSVDRGLVSVFPGQIGGDFDGR